MASKNTVHHTPAKLHRAAQTLANPSSTKQQKSDAGKVLNQHKQDKH